MNNVIKYETYPGCSIDKAAAAESLQLAKKNPDKQVIFDFNGITVIVTSWDTVDSIVERFSRLQQAFSTIYRESPAYKRQQLAEQLRLAALQAKLDCLLTKLPLTKGKETALIAWLGKFAGIADNRNLVWSKEKVAEQLISFGYTANAFLNLPQEDYKCKGILAGYLLGQAIDHLNSGMPPHPMLSSWCEKYEELTSEK
jgi:hypothetical protein